MKKLIKTKLNTDNDEHLEYLMIFYTYCCSKRDRPTFSSCSNRHVRLTDLYMQLLRKPNVFIYSLSLSFERNERQTRLILHFYWMYWSIYIEVFLTQLKTNNFRIFPFEMIKSNEVIMIFWNTFDLSSFNDQYERKEKLVSPQRMPIGLVLSQYEHFFSHILLWKWMIFLYL
jgi:hypothetical protein